jgi:FAD/FMN-containing dehydrogenase
VAWVDELQPGAPDVVSAWRGIDAGWFISVRREVRRRAGTGSTERVVPQLAALADALASIVRALPESALALPGGEEDWNVAQTVTHDTHARAGLVLAAGLAAANRWPADAPTVVPGVPGPADATRDDLLRRIAQSQRVIERSARSIAGHEADPCPLEHPLVGRLRCGEWLLFAGVHDLMHLEQLHRIAGTLEPAGPAAESRTGS